MIRRIKPPAARKTVDLAPYRASVNEAAARTRGMWLGFILLLGYLVVTVGAVTHKDLFLQSPVTLPVLNIGLPLVGFFSVAPVFFLINHFYLLLQVKRVSSRVRDFNHALETAGLPPAEQEHHRRGLDSFLIAQMLGGTDEERTGRTSWFLRAVALLTLVVAPLLLILMIQLQFLAYQSEPVTWLHRIVFLIDLALLWVFWPAIRAGEWKHPTRPVLTGIGAYCLAFFACLIAAFPGEYADGGLNARDWTRNVDSRGWWIKDRIFGALRERKSVLHYQSGLPFASRTLVLDDRTDLIDLTKLDTSVTRKSKDPDSTWRAGGTGSYRDRALRGAYFNRTDLRHMDFERARLQGASLDSARLQGASLDDADLQGASLAGARLQGASLEWASLQGASLIYASLQGASLAGASLQGASLDWASLQGASLEWASLQGASLDLASLQGASLAGASLQGASLDRARLQGASLYSASLQGASLIYASLQGASLDDADLQGASLAGARLQGASLIYASLQGASLIYASLQGASLDDADLQGASLAGARLQGASLEWASLQGASAHSTQFWHVYGMPRTDPAQEVQVRNPVLSALTEQDYKELEALALDGVEDDNIRERIKTRLARMCVLPEHCPNGEPDWLDADYWHGFSLAGEHAPYIGSLGVLLGEQDSVFRSALTRRLREFACDPDATGASRDSVPHIAEGLLSAQGDIFPRPARLEAVGPENLPGLARHLLDAAEGRRGDCPGVKGLSEDAKARLREWAGPPASP